MPSRFLSLISGEHLFVLENITLNKKRNHCYKSEKKGKNGIFVTLDE